jgi:hypothetical protein
LCRANGELACPVESSLGADPLHDNVHDPPAAIGKPLLQAHSTTKVRKVEGKAAGADTGPGFISAFLVASRIAASNEVGAFDLSDLASAGHHQVIFRPGQRTLTVFPAKPSTLRARRITHTLLTCERLSPSGFPTVRSAMLNAVVKAVGEEETFSDPKYPAGQQAA